METREGLSLGPWEACGLLGKLDLRPVRVGSTATARPGGHAVWVDVCHVSGLIRVVLQTPTCVLPSGVAQRRGRLPAGKQLRPAAQQGPGWRGPLGGGASEQPPTGGRSCHAPGLPPAPRLHLRWTNPWGLFSALHSGVGRGRGCPKGAREPPAAGRHHWFPFFEPDSCVQGGVSPCLHLSCLLVHYSALYHELPGTEQHFKVKIWPQGWLCPPGPVGGWGRHARAKREGSGGGRRHMLWPLCALCPLPQSREEAMCHQHDLCHTRRAKRHHPSFTCLIIT